METMERRLEESGIRKIVKLTDDYYFYGGITRNPYVNNINRFIDDCCYDIYNNENEDVSDSRLKELADALRGYFDSDYCVIGKVDGRFLEDCVVSMVNKGKEDEYRVQEKNLKNVNRVRLDNPNYLVCRGLKSNDDITYFDEKDIKKADNYSAYETILGKVNDTTIIPIRDRENKNKGFIQFVNSEQRIYLNNIKPFYDSLLRLILLIRQRDRLKDARLINKDFDFLLEIQKKADNIDLLLKEIMQYFSKEFNAGIVSYRIPLLLGTEKKPLFFLRDCYISDEIAQYNNYSKDDYFKERLFKTVGQMGGYDKLSCQNNETVFIHKAKDSDYYNNISNKEILFRNDTLIIPILRNYSEKDECFYLQKSKDFSSNDETGCPSRFAKYFGVFKLRIFKSYGNSIHEDASEWLSEVTRSRLSNIANHISILLNAFVKKYENESLDVFKKELKGTSFTKIKEFDEQCSTIVKKAIHANYCTIYRYKNNKLTYSASSEHCCNAITDFNDVYKKYSKISDGLVETMFARKESVYFVSFDKGKRKYNSIMLVPMIKKDGTKLGIMLLDGKEDTLRSGNLSKTFWEHDKNHIEFIVDVLTRIEESDSERLTFLSQLSHELLRPITEMVYRNEYHISTAKINHDAYTNRMLIDEMQKNVDMCMMFKYIIDDVEFIYSLSKEDAQYNFELVDLKGIILDAVRIFEEETNASKQLTIKTYLKNMPEKLYIDKSRMTQVVINLLKNAIQYSFANEVISIRYEFNKIDDCHEISFCDNGIPVNPKEKERIFDLFVRSKQAVEKRPSGTGIGLYLIKQIMKAHGGDCFVKEYSSPTIFTIQIPNKNIQS